MLINNRSLALFALLGSCIELIGNLVFLFLRLQGSNRFRPLDESGVINFMTTALLAAVWVFLAVRATSWVERSFFATVLSVTVFNGIASQNPNMDQLQATASFIRCFIWLIATSLAVTIF